MFTDKEIETVSELLAQRMENVTKKTLDLIAKRIKEIGALTPSDAHRLAKLKNIGSDMDEIKRYLAMATNMNINQIDSIYKRFAKDQYDFTKIYYDATGTIQIPFKDNKVLQDIINAQSEITKGTFRNISNSTVFALKDRYGTIQHIPIEKAYQDVVDEAITMISAGITDYQSVLRDRMKEMASSGIRTVNYESGLSRDIYSATRMNILDGVRQVNMKVREYAGKEFGADGYEISVHGLCAPDHVDIQGEQFSISDFDRMNGQLDRPIGTCNCRHSIFPIVLGVSNPVYSKEELDEIKKDNSEKSVEIDGKKYTKYEASQLQRGLETKIRKQKREMETLKKEGDDTGAKLIRNKLRQTQNKYSEVSSIAGLRTSPIRTIGYADGFKKM